MIEYDEGKWLPLLSVKGSVLQKAAWWAIPAATLAGVLSWVFQNIEGDWHQWLQAMDISDRLRDFSFILGFLVVFRSQRAYARWWEGGTLLQQLRGEWFNAFSSLLAFSNPAEEMQKEVERFQHQLARMMSMLYANALRQVSAMSDNKFELIDIEGFDLDSLEHMVTAHDSCEVVLQWVQRLIVQANGKDIIKIAPPILSRVYNQLGNGIVKLNNARKIRQFPIPFPLVQMVAFMLVFHTIVTIFVVSITVHSPALGAAITFVVVMAFWSVNFICIELEQPYGDDENDLPLHSMMEDLNKSLCGLLNPIALSPPEFDYDPAHHGKLVTARFELQEHVEDLIQSGKGRRRGGGGPEIEKEANPAPAPVAPAFGAATGPPLVMADLTPQAAQVGATDKTRALVDPNRLWASVAVDYCFQGAANEGNAVEGLADDKEYRDTLAAAQSTQGRARQSLRLAATGAPQTSGGAQNESLFSGQVGPFLQPSNNLSGAVETKARQAFRSSAASGVTGMLTECIPCQSLPSRRSA